MLESLEQDEVGRRTTEQKNDGHEGGEGALGRGSSGAGSIWRQKAL